MKRSLSKGAETRRVIGLKPLDIQRGVVDLIKSNPDHADLLAIIDALAWAHGFASAAITSYLPDEAETFRARSLSQQRFGVVQWIGVVKRIKGRFALMAGDAAYPAPPPDDWAVAFEDVAACGVDHAVLPQDLCRSSTHEECNA